MGSFDYSMLNNVLYNIALQDHIGQPQTDDSTGDESSASRAASTSILPALNQAKIDIGPKVQVLPPKRPGD